MLSTQQEFQTDSPVSKSVPNLSESTSPLEESTAELVDSLYRDHLTGIGNRRHFEDRLQEALSSSTSQPTLLLLDLDRFKAVNDTLGHAVGDILLRLVSQRFTQLLDHSDTLARLGGDEFGIITHAPANVGGLAARIVDVIQRPYLIEGCPVNIGVSIGIAQAPQDGLDRGQLLKNADLALYQAKATGRCCFLYFLPEMEVRAQEKRELELALRKAVPLRQLELHYRPQVDIETKRLVGLEAMLRWRHPSQGILNPAAFIPIAEEIGIVVSIGEWALKAACQEASRWPDDVTIAVTVSPIQFETKRFFEAVERALKVAGITGSRLELTVTESILLRDGRAVLAILNKLRSIGVRVAIDSFGTGIASLSQMVEFPLDKIKIDRTLIEENGSDAKQRAIVRAIVALGEGLGVSTLVDGVTSPEHLARIQRDGCSSVKGYLSAQAVAGKDLHASVQALLSTIPFNQETEAQS
jgi:diguanylate cyclase (GGDEF)-like protein